ncbi:MAG: DUF475 domain-containing protein, partial [Candidatus Omnitrophica bacterium]|nr:DUF475 domain-containing protein [Candidatus Omnitrophota bacterium]
LIFIGNGLGALVVREFTVRGINLISKFAYLKNGAMYSIGMLGGLMVLEAFGKEYPFWLAPLNTVLLLVIFMFLSVRELKMAEKIVSQNLSVRLTEALVKQVSTKSPKKTKAFKAKDQEIANLEDELRRILGTKVMVEDNKGKGRLIIEYYSLDDLDRVLAVLRKK